MLVCPFLRQIHPAAGDPAGQICCTYDEDGGSLLAGWDFNLSQIYLPKRRRRKWNDCLKLNVSLCRILINMFACSNLCWSIRSVQQPARGSSSEPQTHHLWPLRGRSIGSVQPRYRRPEWKQRRSRVLGPGRPLRWLGVQTTERYKVLFQHLSTLLMSFRILLLILLFPNS